MRRSRRPLGTAATVDERFIRTPLGGWWMADGGYAREQVVG